MRNTIPTSQIRIALINLLLMVAGVVPFVLGWLIGAGIWLVLLCVAAFQVGYQRGRQ